MSDLRVTNLRGRTAGSSPTLPDGVVVTGITTTDTLKVGTGVTISAGIVTATSVSIGGTDVLTAINAKASTGKAIAMAMVFG